MFLVTSIATTNNKEETSTRSQDAPFTGTSFCQTLNHQPVPQVPINQSQQNQPVSNSNKISTSTNQSAFVIPWHSIVPILPVSSGPMSPLNSELSPPFSAPPVPSVTNQIATHDVVEDETDPEPMPITTEDDDDVFETETMETITNSDVNNGNKRRSQSLSALQSANKESPINKVWNYCYI